MNKQAVTVEDSGVYAALILLVINTNCIVWAAYLKTTIFSDINFAVWLIEMNYHGLQEATWSVMQIHVLLSKLHAIHYNRKHVSVVAFK